MNVTTLLENTCEPNSVLIAKHGLSLYLEIDEHKMLFDTGPDDSFIQNAQKLGIDLTEVKTVVISHAHHDHGRGLEAFLKINSQAQVYLNTYVQQEYFAKRDKDEFHYIGLDHEVLKTNRDRLHYIKEKTMILPGITLLINTEHSTFKPAGVQYKKEDGLMVEDSYQHELIMTIEDNGKLHVFTGCSHSGIINMIMSVKKEFPGKVINTLIGGFHLMNPSTGEMREEEATVLGIAASLIEHDIEQVYTGHCTGSQGLGILQGVCGEKVDGIWAGKRISI